MIIFFIPRIPIFHCPSCGKVLGYRQWIYKTLRVSCPSCGSEVVISGQYVVASWRSRSRFWGGILAAIIFTAIFMTAPLADLWTRFLNDKAILEPLLKVLGCVFLLPFVGFLIGWNIGIFFGFVPGVINACFLDKTVEGEPVKGESAVSGASSKKDSLGGGHDPALGDESAVSRASSRKGCLAFAIACILLWCVWAFWFHQPVRWKHGAAGLTLLEKAGLDAVMFLIAVVIVGVATPVVRMLFLITSNISLEKKKKEKK